MSDRSVRVREAASIVLVSGAVIIDIAVDDLGPAVIAVMAALLIAPWRAWKANQRTRRFTRADLAAFAAVVGALMLTLLMPDGPLRWIVIGALVVAYLCSSRLLDPDH